MDHDREDEGRPSESEPNPTQQRIDDEAEPEKPAVVSWEEDRLGETEPAPDEVEPT